MLNKSCEPLDHPRIWHLCQHEYEVPQVLCLQNVPSMRGQTVTFLRGIAIQNVYEETSFETAVDDMDVDLTSTNLLTLLEWHIDGFPAYTSQGKCAQTLHSVAKMDVSTHSLFFHEDFAIFSPQGAVDTACAWLGSCDALGFQTFPILRDPANAEQAAENALRRLAFPEVLKKKAFACASLQVLEGYKPNQFLVKTVTAVTDCSKKKKHGIL